MHTLSVSEVQQRSSQGATSQCWRGEIGVGAGEVGGQALLLGLIDHVAMTWCRSSSAGGSRTSAVSLTAT
jgi:hypothetical protein